MISRLLSYALRMSQSRMNETRFEIYNRREIRNCNKDHSSFLLISKSSSSSYLGSLQQKQAHSPIRTKGKERVRRTATILLVSLHTVHPFFMKYRSIVESRALRVNANYSTKDDTNDPSPSCFTSLSGTFL